MKVYITSNYLTAKSFIKEVLKYCKNKPIYVIDKSRISVLFTKTKNKNFFCSITAKNPVKKPLLQTLHGLLQSA